MYDVIIAGGGPAGMTAAIYARRAGMSVLMLEAAVCGGQIINSMDVDNFPSRPGIPGWQLASEWQKQATDLGVELKIASVSGVEDLGGKKIVITSKGRFEALSVIIATGAGHRRLDCPGADKFTGRGISTCANCDGAFYRDKAVCVVGGGNTAFEDALYLSTMCTKVWIVNRRAQFRAEPELVKKVSGLPNVEILTPYVAHAVEGDLKVSGFEIRNTETDEVRHLDVAGIFTAIGMIPNNGPFAALVDLDEIGYVIADDSCHTKTPGLFVAGDARQKRLRQLVTAASDGAIAATEAAAYVNKLK